MIKAVTGSILLYYYGQFIHHRICKPSDMGGGTHSQSQPRQGIMGGLVSKSQYFAVESLHSKFHSNKTKGKVTDANLDDHAIHNT